MSGVEGISAVGTVERVEAEVVAGHVAALARDEADRALLLEAFGLVPTVRVPVLVQRPHRS